MIRFFSGQKDFRFLAFICTLFFSLTLCGQPSFLIEQFESYDILFYDLEVQFSEEKSRIAGTQTIFFKANKPIKHIWLDMGPDLNIHRLYWKGQALNYEFLGELLRIDFPQTLRSGRRQKIDLVFYGALKGTSPYPVWQRNQRNQFQLGLSDAHIPPYFWWPCKQHGNDPADSMRLKVIIPDNIHIFSSGTIRDTLPINGNRKMYEIFFEEKIIPEKVSLYAGKFESLQDFYQNDMGNHSLTYYIQPERRIEALSHLAQVKRLFLTLEKVLGPNPSWGNGYTWFQPLVYNEGQNLLQNNAFGFDPLLVRDIANQWIQTQPAQRDTLGLWLKQLFPYIMELTLVEKWFDKGTVDSYLSGQKDPQFVAAGRVYRLIKSDPKPELWYTTMSSYLNQTSSPVPAEDDFRRILGKDKAWLVRYISRDNPLPILQYHISGKRRKMRYYFRWKDAPTDFQLPLALRAGQEVTKIIPDQQWKSLILKGVSRKNIGFPPESTWFSLEEVEILTN
ncbi:MAG: hypothetical protein AAFY71_19985 [Bacteroidota bacterium]